MIDLDGIRAKVQQMNNEFAEQRKVFVERQKVIFTEISNLIFQEYPEINSFGWTQHTPYFNDGEPCEFSTNLWDTDNLYINGVNSYGDTWGWDDDAEEDEFEFKFESEVGVISELFGLIPDEVYEEVFGNDQKVKVNRDGTFEQDDYSDHD